MLIRRLGITALELLAEAIFLGLLFGLLLAPSNFNALAVGSLPVVLMLFLHGYYFTRPLVGLLWKRGNYWIYGLIASILFIGHMGIGYARLRPDMRQVSSWIVVTFFVVGCAIVFVCAVMGHRWLIHSRNLAGGSP
jgi:hypothetical protein